MQVTNLVKAAVLSASALWLVGCASNQNSENTQQSEQTEVVEVVDQNVLVETVSVNPRVQAVIDSGKVMDSPEEIEALLNQDTYFFAFDSSDLSAEAYKSLDVHAAYLLSDMGHTAQVVVQGHTDERGTRTYNLALGERRAESVKDYLVAKGVEASRIETISFGFEKPLDPEHNQTAWALNRRAVIITR